MFATRGLLFVVVLVDKLNNSSVRRLLVVIKLGKLKYSVYMHSLTRPKIEWNKDASHNSLDKFVAAV